MTTNRSDIAGKYTLWGVIPNCSYTFTGNDRQASFSVTGDRTQMQVRALNSLSLNSSVFPDFENSVKIVRAKLEPSGAPGLQAAEGKKAAGFFLELFNGDNPDEKVLDYAAINFKNWGEWEEVNKVLRPFKNIQMSDSIDVKFSVQPGSAEFYCDDYNLQEDYVGQTVTPIIVMEVETAGLWDSITHTIF